MNIINIVGNTGYIKGGTNTGVYIFGENALIIDAGHTVMRGERMADFFIKNNIKPEYVYVTHEHFDHFEAFDGIKNRYENAKLIAHKNTKTFIENLSLGMAYLHSSTSPSFFGRRNNDLKNNQFDEGRFKVDITVDEELVLDGEIFKVYHLPGHCMGETVIITPDKVCFLGDTILDNHIIDEYDMPFLYSVELQEISLNKLKTLDFEYGLIGHSKKVYTKSEIVEIVDRNLAVLEKYESDILEFLQTPMSREEILVSLLRKNNIVCSYSSYYYNNSTVGAYIAKLSYQNKIRFVYRNGKIIYSINEVNDGIQRVEKDITSL